MPTFQFEAMDATGHEIKDKIQAESDIEAQSIIRSMGYYVTKINLVEDNPEKTEKKTEKTREENIIITLMPLQMFFLGVGSAAGQLVFGGEQNVEKAGMLLGIFTTIALLMFIVLKLFGRKRS